MQDKTNSDSHKGKLVYIATYGCQMNYSDTERIESYLDRLGFHSGKPGLILRVFTVGDIPQRGEVGGLAIVFHLRHPDFRDALE